MSLIAFQTCESLLVTIIFFSSAQLLSIMATNSQSRRGTSCIKCNVFQPHGGKLLSCMHLICAGCCRDEIAQDSNTIKCMSCSAITKAVVSGVGIADQLMSSEPYLYKASDAALASDPAGNQADEPKLCCEFCDEDDTSAVTHECGDCDAAPLCQKHAEKHLRMRMFIGHVVTKLNSEQRSDGRRRLVTRSTRCLVHKHNYVVTFCKTCSHSICSQCLAVGHHGHTVATLSSVAAERLSAVRAAIGPSSESLQSASQSANSMETPPIQDMLNAVSGEMEEIRKEAETASRVVTEMFGQVDAIVQKKREQLLHQINTIHWQQLEVRQSRQQCLHGIEECYGTVTQLVKCMTGGDMDDEDVIRFSGSVLSNLTKMSSDIDSEKTPLQRGRIRAAPIAEALRELEKQVQSLVLVEEVLPIDVTKVIVTLPNNVHPDEQSTVGLTFPGVTTTEPPVLTAKISPPSGGSYDAGICNSSASSITELVMSASFTTREVGWHYLEVSDSAGRTKSIPFECRLPGPLALDQQKCSRHITVSDSNHVATHTGTGSDWASVAANDGYTTGRHTWNVKIHKTQGNAGYMYFGVCDLPDDGNCDGTDYFFHNKRNYSWGDDGRSIANGNYSGVNFSELKDGDTATLTLDCEQKTLQIHHQRTDERRTIPNVNCGKPLYPAICMFKPGRRAEIQ